MPHLIFIGIKMQSWIWVWVEKMRKMYEAFLSKTLWVLSVCGSDMEPDKDQQATCLEVLSFSWGSELCLTKRKKNGVCSCPGEFFPSGHKQMLMLCDFSCKTRLLPPPSHSTKPASTFSQYEKVSFCSRKWGPESNLAMDYFIIAVWAL